MTLFILCITIAYLMLIGSFIIGFDRIKPYPIFDLEAKTTFTIIIAFKNEANNLNNLLDSISKLDYPSDMFEVILVNDKSEDVSENIIMRYITNTRSNIKLIQNDKKTNSPKKDAINTAISEARFEWIVTTDADSILPKHWLNSFDNFIQKNHTKFIVAPVTYYKINSFIKRFQILDFISLQGATIGGFGIKNPFLCNGANLAYTKDFFLELNGFEGNTNIASGDDIFLLEKAVQHRKEQVHYLKSELSIVKTKPQPDLKNLLSQRIRWAAKTSNYQNWFGKFTGIMVLLMNASIIYNLVFAFIGTVSAKFFVHIYIIKLSVDFLLIYKTSRFFNQEKYLSSFFISALLYPFFSVFIACVSVFVGYKWKGVYYKK